MDSKLQIISGKYRGKKLAWPVGARPTSMRAKIALFNILAPIVKQMQSEKAPVIWDVYAGSGAVGAEFLSRGWVSGAIFTDSDPAAIKIISQNLKDMAGSSRITIEKGEMPGIAGKFVEKAGIIFLDPPYSEGTSLGKTITMLAKSMNRNAILIVEFEHCPPTENRKAVFDSPAWGELGLEVLARRNYGRAGFVVFRKK